MEEGLVDVLVRIVGIQRRGQVPHRGEHRLPVVIIRREIDLQNRSGDCLAGDSSTPTIAAITNRAPAAVHSTTPRNRANHSERLRIAINSNKHAGKNAYTMARNHVSHSPCIK